ncbi:Anaerobic sulfatase-maturating enzyme [Peptostreptococcus anaerobius]|uniref:Anaerobic sulfatase-maturating enzyme n=1 Tax=Peptostreptococcus anaerobius TaxID=1261 RepID=A0A379CF89_9FIRM|nr:radical SAM protein [Peptostreptococcus anaerobius]SFN35827.1 uncharacterized protein SAMN05660467_02006 [Peptostreptococcus anaerobius]SUB60317.1 Anaerobic sulfatase-maturating enzyme [Peptostreptococcus anaerobius]
MNFNILVTNKCNLSCKYCYEKTKNEFDLSVDMADKIIYFIKCEIHENNPDKLKIVFHGGEPTLNFDIIKYIISSLEDIKLLKIYEMTSNGFLINTDIIKYIYEKKINLSISLDGREFDNDLNRVDKNGKGTYKSVIKNIESLIKMNVNIRCRMTVTKSNILNLVENISELINKGIKNFAIALDFYEDKWNQNDYNSLLFSIKKLKENYKNSDINISIIDESYSLSEKSDCLGGISSFTLDSNGDIYPCLFALNSKKFKLGNLDENTLVEIRKKGRILCKERYSIKSFCDECKAKKICDGNRCKILSYIVKGSYEFPIESLCITTRAIIDSM